MKKLIRVAAFAVPKPARATTEWVRDEVVKLDPARSSVKVAAASTRLKIGDKLRFQALEHESQWIVRQMEVRQ